MIAQALLLTLAAVPVVPFPTGEVQTINLIEWNSNQLPRIYERSDQLPLTDEEVAKLRDAIAAALADGVGGELRG